MKKDGLFYQKRIADEVIDYIVFLNKKSYNLLFFAEEVKHYDSIIKKLYNKEKNTEDEVTIPLTGFDVYNSIKELKFLETIMIEILVDFDEETRDTVMETFKQNSKSNQVKVKTKIM